jgi:hypothetical protein
MLWASIYANFIVRCAVFWHTYIFGIFSQSFVWRSQRRAHCFCSGSASHSPFQYQECFDRRKDRRFFQPVVSVRGKALPGSGAFFAQHRRGMRTPGLRGAVKMEKRGSKGLGRQPPAGRFLHLGHSEKSPLRGLYLEFLSEEPSRSENRVDPAGGAKPGGSSSVYFSDQSRRRPLRVRKPKGKPRK